MGLYFDDFRIGEQFKTFSRTVTEVDIVNYTGISGDFNAIHIDKEFSKKGMFGERIAHGMLIVTMATGMIHQLNIIDDTTIALLEWKEIKFKKPVFIGDTIHVELEVLEKKEVSKPDQGIITLGLSIKKQTEEVISAKMVILINRVQR